MNWPTKEEVKKIREKYPPGTVIQLIYMDDPTPVPSGTIGEVYSVDDMGQLHIEWVDYRSRSLAVIPGKDKFNKIGYTKRCRYCQNLAIGRTFECKLNDKKVDMDNDSCDDFEAE